MSRFEILPLKLFQASCESSTKLLLRSCRNDSADHSIGRAFALGHSPGTTESFGLFGAPSYRVGGTAPKGTTPQPPARSVDAPCFLESERVCPHTPLLLRLPTPGWRRARGMPHKKECARLSTSHLLTLIRRHRTRSPALYMDTPHHLERMWTEERKCLLSECCPRPNLVCSASVVVSQLLPWSFAAFHLARLRMGSRDTPCGENEKDLHKYVCTQG